MITDRITMTQRVSWTPIITAACLAGISAYLVFNTNWDPLIAIMTVGLSALGIAIALISAIYLFIGADDRQSFIATIIKTMHEDLAGLAKLLGYRA